MVKQNASTNFKRIAKRAAERRNDNRLSVRQRRRGADAARVPEPAHSGARDRRGALGPVEKPLPTKQQERLDHARLRAALRQSNLVPDLRQFFHGTGRELTPLQVKVGLALLDKAYPSVKAIELDGQVNVVHSKAELEEKMQALGIPIDGVWQRLDK